MKGALVVVVIALATACSRQAEAPAPASQSMSAPEGAAWLLSGTNDERFARVANHLRGFDLAMVETGYRYSATRALMSRMASSDLAMVETGYRYSELYWAGQDGNWDYATYQIEKIRLAVRNGIERRPKRGSSAQVLEGALAGVEDSIEAKDATRFAERFDTLTATCNACHHAERVPFAQVRTPMVRSSPIGPPQIDRGLP